MLDRIEASLEREREFVADASHELRTPLAVLRAELELARRPGREPEEMRAALRSAEEETTRLSRLAEDLLLIARTDDGGLPLKVETTELAPLLERVRDRFEQIAAASGRELRSSASRASSPTSIPFGSRRPSATSPTTPSRTAVERSCSRRAEIAARCRLEVRDDGAGFPPAFAERAFERFTRADPARSGGGAGLGLAIVRAVAEAHGGTARIASSSSHPTSVEIELQA